MFHLAQVNVAKTVAPFGEPAMAGLTSRVNEINSLAESSPGFVWRYKNPEGWDWARPFSDFFPSFEPEHIFFNMSVWKTPGDLRHFIFDTKHIELMRSKHEWILPPKRPHLAMWWIPQGCIPTVQDARRRLSILEQQGPGPDAFIFSQIFPPPAVTA